MVFCDMAEKYIENEEYHAAIRLWTNWEKSL